MIRPNPNRARRVASLLAGALLMLGAFAGPALAQGIFETMPYAGYLEEDGTPYDGQVNITFRLYQDAQAIGPVWQETHLQVEVIGGYFVVELGREEPLRDGIDEGTARYLGIDIDNTGEAQPRMKINSMPFAMRARDADYLGGYSADRFVTEDALEGVVTWDRLGERGYVTWVALGERGYVTWDALDERGYATWEALGERGYATWEEIDARGYVTAADLEGYASWDELAERGYVSWDALGERGYVTNDDLEQAGYLDANGLQAALEGYVSVNDLADRGYISADALDARGYVTADALAERGYLDAADLAGYVTSAELDGRGYITGGDVDARGYITGADVDARGYITGADVDARGYITAAALDGYVTNADLDGRGYARAQDLDAYVTTAELDGRGYITNAALDGYVTAAVLDGRGYITGDALDARGYIDAGELDARGYIDSAALDARNYVTTGALNARGYISGAELNARNYVSEAALNARGYITAGALDARDYVSGAELDALDYVDAAQLGALQAQIDRLRQDLDAARSGAFLLGRSAQSSNGRFAFNNQVGIKAAHEMCQVSYPAVSTAHMCSPDEVFRAVASGAIAQNATYDGVDTWTVAQSKGASGSALLSSCQNLMYNSGDASLGVRLRVQNNYRSVGNGGGLTGAVVHLEHDIGCGTPYPVLCCR